VGEDLLLLYHQRSNQAWAKVWTIHNRTACRRHKVREPVVWLASTTSPDLIPWRGIVSPTNKATQPTPQSQNAVLNMMVTSMSCTGWSHLMAEVKAWSCQHVMAVDSWTRRTGGSASIARDRDVGNVELEAPRTLQAEQAGKKGPRLPVILPNLSIRLEATIWSWCIHSTLQVEPLSTTLQLNSLSHLHMYIETAVIETIIDLLCTSNRTTTTYDRNSRMQRHNTDNGLLRTGAPIQLSRKMSTSHMVPARLQSTCCHLAHSGEKSSTHARRLEVMHATRLTARRRCSARSRAFATSMQEKSSRFPSWMIHSSTDTLQYSTLRPECSLSQSCYVLLLSCGFCSSNYILVHCLLLHISSLPVADAYLSGLLAHHFSLSNSSTRWYHPTISYVVRAFHPLPLPATAAPCSRPAPYITRRNKNELRRHYL